MFPDALDRLAPIHWEWINSWDAFIAILKVRFKNTGLKKIEKGKFAVRSTKTDRDLDIRRPWEASIFRGQLYDMSMLFREVNGSCPTSCVVCSHFCEGETGQDIKWYVNGLLRLSFLNASSPKCNTTFRRIIEIEEQETETDIFSQVEASPRPFSPQRHATRKRKRETAPVIQEKIKDFSRVRVLSRTVGERIPDAP